MPCDAFDALDRTKRYIVRAHEWTLCVGAGICKGIMPDWLSITSRMLGRACGAISPREVEAITQNLNWSLDSILQYALNNYLLTARSVDDFNNDLAAELYGELLRRASAEGLDGALRKLLSNPFSRDPNHILQLESFLSSQYGNSSLMQIARVLLRSKDSDQNPNAVLNFNADVLLHTALTLLQIRQSFSASRGIYPDFYYRAVYRSVNRTNGKIPIYHIHGSITPESGLREAREKLVFPESTYSHLAGSIYAWPQTTFLANAQSSRIIFVGLSMSDPNIRRWLSWCEGYRRDEIAIDGTNPTFLSQHIWITTRSPDPCVQRAKETGLLHLGVRTGFIPDWGRLEEALENLIGL
jgi:hypothetical protein